MKIKNVLREIKSGIYSLDILKSCLSAFIIYLVSYLILILMKVPPFRISLTIMLFFFVSEIIVFTKKEHPLNRVEKKYNQMSEELKTSHDTLHKKNELILSLRDDVVKKAKKYIDMSDFIDYRNVLSKFLYILFFSYMIILVASLNLSIPYINAEDLPENTNKLINTFTNEETSLTNDGFGNTNLVMQGIEKATSEAGISGGKQKGGEIYGSESKLELGDEEIDMKIQPTDYEHSVEDYDPVKDKDFKSKPFEGEVTSEKEESYSEEVSVKNQDIVKKYFKQLASS